MLPFVVSEFHGLRRKAFPSDWFLAWFWDAFSVGCRDRLSQAVCLCRAGWQGGEREVPVCSNRVASLPVWSAISSSLSACVFLSLSLCRLLLSASCLSHPKSWAKPFTCLGLMTTLRGRYYCNSLILQVSRLRFLAMDQGHTAR